MSTDEGWQRRPVAPTGWTRKPRRPLIDQYVQRLGSFLDAMADGKIEPSELKTQEARVVALMKTIEPELDDELHEQVTHLLCELSAYNIMHTIHQFMETSAQDEVPGLNRDRGRRSPSGAPAGSVPRSPTSIGQEIS